MRTLNAIVPLIVAGIGFVACAGGAAAAETKAAEVASKAAAAPTVKLIDQRLKLAKDGSASLAVRVQISAAAGKIDLPIAAWGEVRDFTVEEAPADAKVDMVAKGANPHLSVTLPAAAEPVSLRYSATIPAPKPPARDARGGDAAKPATEDATRFKTFTHRFMNDTNLPVERYRLEVMFPDGYVVHNVPEALPKARGKETVSRVSLMERDGLQGAALEIAGLKLGDTTSMRIEYEPAQKSLAVFWFGLLLSVLYLVFFRDVLRAKSAPNTAERHARDSHKEHE